MKKANIPAEESQIEKMITTGVMMLLFGLASVWLFPTDSLVLSLWIFTSALIAGTLLLVLGVVKSQQRIPKVKKIRIKRK